MIFLLGIIAGLLIAILIVVTMTYFRRVIEHKTVVVEKMIENAGPKPQGFIFEPEDEASEAREQIIARNKALGIDTPLSQLR